MLPEATPLLSLPLYLCSFLSAASWHGNWRRSLLFRGRVSGAWGGTETVAHNYWQQLPGRNALLMSQFVTQASELPIPLEDETLWLTGGDTDSTKVLNGVHDKGQDDSRSAHVLCSNAGRSGGVTSDGSSLIPYLRIQLAALSGTVSLRSQIEVMQRLLLMLLPLMQGSSAPRTFLRCMFFKKPYTPIMKALKEQRSSLGAAAAKSDSLVLALTSNLPLLRLFCAAYLRLCFRLQALCDFGAQESFVFEEECELGSDVSPWDGFFKVGLQAELAKGRDGRERTLQQYTDCLEQLCLRNALCLWQLEDTCVTQLLQWGPHSESTRKDKGSQRAYKTRQDRVLHCLVEEAEALGSAGDFRREGRQKYSFFQDFRHFPVFCSFQRLDHFVQAGPGAAACVFAQMH